MQEIDFNDNWIFRNDAMPEISKTVNLPHDAMFLEKRDEKNPSARHGCWFGGSNYSYEKKFVRPVGSVYFEFESVYRNCEVFINGIKAIARDYGYTCFNFCADDFLTDGENIITVSAKNSDQPNSRWYSGAGIIRPVKMYVLPHKHILFNGVKIKTVDYKTRTVKVDIRTCCEGYLNISVVDGDDDIYSTEIYTDGETDITFDLPLAELWSANNPKLYSLKLKFFQDEREIAFGIRQIECSAVNGLLINGIRTLLKGACIHHDNGILGAAGHPFAERRKIKLLKNAGYNAIRSAHNPASRSVLRACDELGMYVLDEYTDMWYIHKTRFDYADYFEKNYLSDLDEMIEKDYNHPSVIMYSVGNEVSETAENRGIALCKEMTDYIHLKDYRPVTCGVNIFFNYLSSLGFGVYSDKKANKSDESVVGSEFFNMLAGKFGDKAMKIGATLGGCDRKTKDAFANLDVAGYNYGILRYKKDVKKYPNRIILGTETFCKDAYEFIKIAEKNPSVIGDFVWAGMDYLGEVGVGSWVYKPYTESFLPKFGWITAGSGRIDLIGDTAGETLYTKVAFGQIPLAVAVVPADKCFEKHSPSAWKMSNALESWSYNGCNGKKTVVEVYSRAHSVKLFINGKQSGCKKIKKNCIVKFKVKYFDGILKAKAFDRSGKLIAVKTLKTAKGQTKLSVLPESDTVGINDLVYVKIRFTDIDGELKPLINGKIKLEVVGGDLLAFGNACPFNKEGYDGYEKNTYYGSALAVISPTSIGKITVTAKCEYIFGTAEITVK